MQCARHPKVETLLRCGKCGCPICPGCTVYGPAGARCPDCASLRSSPLFQVPGKVAAIATAVGLVTGAVLGAVVVLASGYGVLATLWVSALGGGACGEAVLRALQHKRGRVAEAVAGSSVAVGGLVGVAMRASETGIGLAGIAASPLALGGVAIAVACVVSRVRYI